MNEYVSDTRKAELQKPLVLTARATNAEVRALIKETHDLRRAPYIQLEIEHCIATENRWGDPFVEAVHDPERATLSDVLEEFWTVYGRRHAGMADALHDTNSHDKAVEIAGALSICAFNSIPVVDNSPEGHKGKCHGCGKLFPYTELDGKDDGSGNYTILMCKSCYGEGWAPM